MLLFLETRIFTNLEAIIILYFSYVRSKIQYASVIWFQYYKIQKYLVEKLGSNFLK